MSRQFDSPVGWGYNPSSWKQRIPIAVIALIPGTLALYLAAYQLHWVSGVWDPAFGSGTERVLGSPVSKAFPVSDALLGAIGYYSEFVTSLIGGQDRFRTMPWFVFLFGLTCVPFTFIAVALLFLMPTVVKSWCLICVITTFFSAILTPFAWDEIWASILEVRRTMRQGATFWGALMGKPAREAQKVSQQAA